ncbi:MAG: hypothetical protein RIS44_2989 [Pseudomonadota bacterium]
MNTAANRNAKRTMVDSQGELKSSAKGLLIVIAGVRGPQESEHGRDARPKLDRVLAEFAQDPWTKHHQGNSGGEQLGNEGQ